VSSPIASAAVPKQKGRPAVVPTSTSAIGYEMEAREPPSFASACPAPGQWPLDGLGKSAENR